MLSTPKARGGLFLASSLCDGLEDNDIKQVTTLLLNKEADPNVLIPSHGVTPFHLVIGNDSEAFAEEVTKLFLRHGGNPNVRSSDGLTPVHVAAAWGRLAVLELLLANGGDPLRVDDEGRNPFHYAFDGKYYKAITILGKYCEENTDDDKNIKYTMAFDKLVINNGDVMAEYAATENSDLNENDVLTDTDPEFKRDAATSSPNYDESSISIKKNLSNNYSPWFPSRRRRDSVSKRNRDLAELELHEAMEKEKHLVNKIIDQLSTSLKSKYHNENKFKLRNVKLESSEVSTSDLNSSYSMSTDENIPPHNNCTKEDKYYLQKKIKDEAPTTPKSVGKVLTQSNNMKLTSSPRQMVANMLRSSSSRIPLSSSHYYTNDAILSKSPNLKINCESYIKSLNTQSCLSPKRTKQQNVQKPKAFTPVLTKCNDSNRFEELRRLGKQTARSTPRRKRSLYHHRTPLRKFKQNNTSSDTLTSSPDSATSFSPCNESRFRMSERKIDNRLVIKLDETKFEDEEMIKHNDTLEDINSRLKLLDCFGTTKDQGKKFLDNDYRKKLEDTLNSSDSRVKHSSGFNSNESFESANDPISEDEGKRINIPIEKFTDKGDNGTGILQRPGIKTLNDLNGEISSLASFRSARSFVSVQEDYKYEDAEKGVALLERRFYVVPSSKASEDEGVDPDSTGQSKLSYFSLAMDLPNEFQSLSNQALRQRLTYLGENPGPITCTTRNVYLKRLVKLERLVEIGKRQTSNISSEEPESISSIRPTMRYGDWVNHLHTYKLREKDTFKEFMNPDHTRRWREGVNKTSFNYLLLDPKITNDLPNRAIDLTDSEVWHTFLSAIFYIGKGKQSRPYAHLYDAFNVFCNSRNEYPGNRKIQRILEIWNEGHGVVCLHVFQNVIPVEAYTREAAMIDAMGIDRLTNKKTGDYYGLAATWNVKEKSKFGRYLLFKALQIFLHDGERQLLPDHL